MNKAITYVGEAAVNVYAAKVLASALTMYAKHKMQVNRMYTPTRMLQAAAAITGVHFKRGEHARAAEALRNWISQAALVRTETEHSVRWE
jgi:hypothetical protein